MFDERRSFSSILPGVQVMVLFLPVQVEGIRLCRQCRHFALDKGGKIWVPLFNSRRAYIIALHIGSDDSILAGLSPHDDDGEARQPSELQGTTVFVLAWL